MKLLVIDDDPMIADFIRLSLGERGHVVDVAHTGDHGRMLAMVYEYDALVLDFVLPDTTGVDVLRELRGRGRAVPVLMLTARSGPEHEVHGLDAGADDYLSKPFSMEVLEARLRALVRRGGGASQAGEATLGGLRVDRLRRAVTAGGKPLKLTPREYALLEYLLSRPERVVTRSELLEKVWDMSFDPGSNVVDVHVARIRAKLQSAASGAALVTLRGAGYMLTASGEGSATPE
ncbi:response regulator transcription factor [Longimicrobium sp.]|uniref:response regulator transcription factor n=1 Tax=Longimicrobium sp. TaxID=2029185 RepID=UPI003B3A06B7